MALSKESYRWKIDYWDAEKMKTLPTEKYIESDVFAMHGLKLYFRLYPKNSNQYIKGKVSIHLYVATFPSNLSKMRFKYHLKSKVADEELCKTDIAVFTGVGNGISQSSFCETDKLIKHNSHSFRFDFSVQILEKWDKDGREIGAEEAEQKEQLTHDSAFKSLESRVLKLETQIQEILQTIKPLKNDKSNDRFVLKQWLTDQVGLPQYHDLFITNGIDKLDIVKLLTADVLKEIGIDIVGHKIRILHQVVILNEI